MRILLINPPYSEKNLIVEYAAPDLKERLKGIVLVGPPQALCSIAGNLLDFEVEIFDLKAEYRLGMNLSLEEVVVKKVKEFRPQIVGVTVITSEYNSSLRILEFIKRHDPGILTIAGGIHATLCPEDFHHPAVDITVIGPGKKIFRDIVVRKLQNQSFADLPNIYWRRNGHVGFTEKRSLFDQPGNLLSEIQARRDLVEKYRDAYRISKHRGTQGYIETSLGCPNRCTFCSIWPMNEGRYFTRKIDDIIKELKGMTHFDLIRFVDANTMGDEKHISELFDKIIAGDLQKIFMMDIRANTAAYNEELMKKAAEAGVVISVVGLETIDEAELAKYNKKSDLYTTMKAIENFHKYQIRMRASFMIRPDYDDHYFYRIKRFVRENELKYAAFSVMTPIPGTLLYRQYQEQIRIKDYDYYTLFNSVLPTKLPTPDFYRQIGELYRDQELVT